MKDHKGYRQRPFDHEDQIVLWACAAAFVALILAGFL